MNRIYEIDEGRPIWKLRPVMLLITLVTVLLAAIVAVGLVLTGPAAEAVGSAIGLESTAVTVWSIAKWPVLLAVVVLIVALLYYATPNVKQPKFRWISVGAIVAIVVWVIASAAFGFYVANFSSYDKTYGSLAGVIAFLLWLWITNLALLFGAELDAELERGRQLQAGIAAEEELQLPPRDTRKSDKAAAKEQEDIERGRRLRESQRTTLLGHRGTVARKASTSAAVGADSGPRRVTLMAAAALARRQPSTHGVPAATSASSAPVWVSPAPLVSTGVCGKPGTYVVAPATWTAQPSGPSRTIATASPRSSGAIAVVSAARSSGASWPTARRRSSASSALLDQTSVTSSIAAADVGVEASEGGAGVEHHDHVAVQGRQPREQRVAGAVEGEREAGDADQVTRARLGGVERLDADPALGPQRGHEGALGARLDHDHADAGVEALDRLRGRGDPLGGRVLADQVAVGSGAVRAGVHAVGPEPRRRDAAP